MFCQELLGDERAMACFRPPTQRPASPRGDDNMSPTKVFHTRKSTNNRKVCFGEQAPSARRIRCGHHNQLVDTHRTLKLRSVG